MDVLRVASLRAVSFALLLTTYEEPITVPQAAQRLEAERDLRDALVRCASPSVRLPLRSARHGIIHGACPP